MKAVLVVLFLVVVWCVVGHFFPLVSLSLAPFLLPVTLYFSKKILGKSLNRYVYSAFGFGVILLHDYLFRSYGGGMHDDAGRAICEVVFYATLVTSAISLMVLQVKSAVGGKAKIIEVLFILALTLVTFFIFRNLSMSV